MSITQPTIDDFQDTTVMRVIRKVVNYLVTLVPKVNEEIDNLNMLNEQALAQQDAKITANTNNISAIGANVEALNKELPSDIRVNYDASTGNFNIDYVKEDGDTLTSNTVVIVSGSTGEVTIVQNTSGISINGIALQSATTAQPGLMTPALVSSLNNVNDTTNDHTTMLNAQAEAITALDGRVDTLEQAGSSGGEVWEELDLSNLPTDFSSGDRVKILFKAGITSSNPPSSWDATFSASQITISTSFNPSQVFEFSLPSGNSDVRYPIFFTYSLDFVGVLIAMVYTSGGWNSNQIIRLGKVGYNGASLNYSSSAAEISRSNVSTYIKKMWRLKK